MKAVEGGAIPRVLVNMMNEDGKISRSHALPLVLLQQQANAMDIPVMAVPASWEEYEKKFIHTLTKINEAHNVEAVVFGDIELQAHRDWEEMVCMKAGLTALLPLWKRQTKDIVLETLQHGIEAIIVSCNTFMGEHFLGRRIDHQLISELEALGVDTCGENGEYHTLVVNCPLFSEKINLPPFSKVRNEEYHFLRWEIAGEVGSRE